MRPIVILMRYSVMVPVDPGKTSAWIIGRDKSAEEYRAALFDDKRLTERLVCLRNIVLPSLLAQSKTLLPEHRLVVITSSELPAPHLAALEQTLADYPWAKIVTVPPTQKPNFTRITREALDDLGFSSGPFATVRLDDDDALCRDYLWRLSSNITAENVGKAVTYPTGYLGVFNIEAGRFTDFFEYDKPFTALGLAAISHYDGADITPSDRRTIYDYGAHHRIGESHKFIEDRSLPSYVRSIYPTQDTAGFKREMTAPVDPDDVFERVEFTLQPPATSQDHRPS